MLVLFMSHSVASRFENVKIRIHWRNVGEYMSLSDTFNFNKKKCLVGFVFSFCLWPYSILRPWLPFSLLIFHYICIFSGCCKYTLSNITENLKTKLPFSSSPSPSLSLCMTHLFHILLPNNRRKRSGMRFYPCDYTYIYMHSSA